ncbi:menaquinone-dependent protoporphyrinogen IX dehydrogenase [Mannheimia granulomatis]|uniref:menaquinone-dependent protoporphyrinogen IX dehydrogenase n=1 Tax=Mannheimia granulomatis TaxID=85402 RepID=UPI0004799D41|nr:menaquinone-dependent protoporphyrinogen IX dehydrogenase [Mannheimia granulomatis]QLB17993.1 protoporphyrinogen oxidase [Mannheimia granulomatis]QLB19929.1 protoporphyrinogen oxidase [Mannheimia granulomatis]
MKTLILYFTTDGQTLKIAERLASVITHEVELISLKDQAVDFAEKIANADQIVIGASIRYGHFNPLVYQFVEQYYDIFNRKKTAFYGVNLTARKANRNTPQTNTYIRKFLAKIQWQPTYVEVFAGALFYPRYTTFDRIMIRFIMKITKGDTDTSKEYEYTDWQQVENFGKLLSNGL